MEHKGTKTLETERLILRPFTINDAEAMYHNWANDPEVTEYLSWSAHESVNVTSKILKSWVTQYEDLEYYQWAITLKEEDNMPIGSISIVGKKELIKSVSMGYCIGKRWWSKGITSEALTILIKFFFEEVGVNRLVAEHDPANPNSGKVMEKCGFKYEGTLRSAIWTPHQGLTDSVVYAILAEDYKQ